MYTNILSGRLFLPMIFLALSLSVNAQNKKEAQQIRSQYNLSKLQKIEQDFSTESQIQKQEALKMAKQRGWETKVTNPDGSYMELQRVENGRPIYYCTTNVNSARSSRTNHLNSGGSLGLNLMGQNMTAYVWDGGVADRNHREYDGPGGNNRYTPGDGSASRDHAAHVAGTIMASGVTASAKGMAPHARVIGYDWNSDLSEATSAAANGMLVSNHSYSLRGEPASSYGAYITESRNWDRIMFNAPNYLVITSAGNNGTANINNNPVGGVNGYDKLVGRAAAKNTLTVANARNANIDNNGNLISVSINSGSSQGPTDDLRIKPDIAGNGTNIYSTLRNNTYASYTGTSMSSPNVTGTLLLLQQHQRNTHGFFMKAATLKGLALHTADDAGTNGPDPNFGWGLLNAKRAAEAITQKGNQSRIEELTLSAGQTYTITVNSDNVNPLLASISWTDRAGTVNNSANSPNPVLVNDLDIRVTKSGTTYSPWRLTGVTTNGRGDNTVDPYERVDISRASGSYTITVTHKGSLTGGSQAFSLIITGVTDTQTPCTATVPTGVTASSVSGTSATISWSAVSGATYDVRYRQTGTSSWTTVASSGTSASLSGLNTTTQYEVQVRSKCSSGNSNYSSSINFTTTTVEIDYCTPSAGSPDGQHITNVTIGSINNNSGAGNNGYTDYTAQSTDLSGSGTLSVTAQSTWALTKAKAWVDWNKDGTFSNSEEVLNGAGTVTNRTYTSTITVPNGASGAVRLRVRVAYSSDPTPCGNIHFSDTEDYTLNLGGINPGDTQAPTKPTNLTVTSVTDDEVNLSWTASTDNVGVTGYDVYRDGNFLGTTDNGDTTARIFNLEPNTRYTFYVIAVDAAGNKSTASDTITATTGGTNPGDTQAPTKPTNLTVTSVTDDEVNLSWTASTDNVGVTGYDVYRDGNFLGTTAIGDTTARVFNLDADTRYTFYVIAVDEAGNKSTASDTVTATTTGGGGTNPEYCTPSAGNSGGQHITNVTIGSINNNSGAGTNGYTDNTSQSTNISGSESLSVTTQATWALTKAKAWVDWNGDGTFSNSEEVLNGSGSATNRTYTSNVSVPNGISGAVRLRVRASYSNDPTPCGTIYFSDTEDYTINVSSSGANVNLSKAENAGISFFPNPASNFVTIQGNSLVSYRVINIIGQTVQKGKLTTNQVNLSNLRNGIYTIEVVRNDQKTFRSKILKK
ncbi:GEVED domain-containing protein [Aquimarina sp. 2201CG1-2-11]|uniref:fibronectin type III domain-containing protein n=1 Tax=Aquimarina discodermiae TaxID=3231043 RepID=UPI003462B422